MTDLSKLSDQELLELEAKERNPQAFSQPTGESVIRPQDEIGLSSLSDEELLSLEKKSVAEQISQKIPSQNNLSPVIYSMFNWSGNPWEDVPKKLAIDGILSPMVELSKGVMKGNAGIYDLVGGSLNVLRNLSGNVLPTKAIEDYAKSSADSIRKDAEFLPSTGMNKVLEFVYGGIGSAPAETVPFLLPGGGAMNTVSKIAVSNTLKEYKDEQGLKETTIDLAKGYAEGAVAVAALNAGAFVLTKAGTMLHNFGRDAAETFIRLSTGNEQLAKDYVNGKVKLSKIIDQRTNEEITKAFDIERENLRREISAKLNDARELAKIKSQDLTARLSLEKEKLSVSNRDANIALNESGTERLQSVRETANQTIINSENLMKEKAADIYKSALDDMNATKRALSDEVGWAKKKLENLAPETGVSYNAQAYIDKNKVNIFQQIEKALTKDFGFIIKNGKVVPKPGTAAVGGQDARLVQTYLDDLLQFKKEGVVPVGAVYRLHETASKLANAAYEAKNNETAAMWARIRKLTEPDSILIEGEGLIASDSNARSLLYDLIKANKKFSTYKTTYDDAMSIHSKPNGRGGFEPNPEFAFNAIRNNDRKVLARMQKVDSELPESQRMFSKVKDLYKDYQDIKSMQESSINLQKKLLNKEKENLRKKTRESEIRLSQENRKITNEEAAKTREFIRQTRGELESKQDAEMLNLDAAENSIKYNKMLNSMLSTGKFAQLQIASAAFFAGKGNLGALASVLALSPKMQRQLADNVLLKIPNRNILEGKSVKGIESLEKLLKIKK